MAAVIGQDVEVRVNRIARHRNGVTGTPFHVVAFENKISPKVWEALIAIVFDEPGSVAVLNPSQIVTGVLSLLNGAAYRGDVFEGPIRAAITRWEDDE